MNINVTSNASLAQLPSTRQADSTASQAAKTAEAAKPASSGDSLEFSVSPRKLGKGLLGIAGGTGTAIVGGTAATAAFTLIAEKGIPKDFGGYLAAGGLLVGGGAGLLGAASSALVTNDPKTGAVVGSLVGGAAAGAYMGKTLGTLPGALLGGALGALAGGIGGYTAAKIKQ